MAASHSEHLLSDALLCCILYTLNRFEVYSCVSWNKSFAADGDWSSEWLSLHVGGGLWGGLQCLENLVLLLLLSHEVAYNAWRTLCYSSYCLMRWLTMLGEPCVTPPIASWGGLQCLENLVLLLLLPHEVAYNAWRTLCYSSCCLMRWLTMLGEPCVTPPIASWGGLKCLENLVLLLLLPHEVAYNAWSTLCYSSYCLMRWLTMLGEPCVTPPIASWGGLQCLENLVLLLLLPHEVAYNAWRTLCYSSYCLMRWLTMLGEPCVTPPIASWGGLQCLENPVLLLLLPHEVAYNAWRTLCYSSYCLMRWLTMLGEPCVTPPIASWGGLQCLENLVLLLLLPHEVAYNAWRTLCYSSYCLMRWLTMLGEPCVTPPIASWGGLQCLEDLVLLLLLPHEVAYNAWRTLCYSSYCLMMWLTMLGEPCVTPPIASWGGLQCLENLVFVTPPIASWGGLQCLEDLVLLLLLPHEVAYNAWRTLWYSSYCLMKWLTMLGEPCVTPPIASTLESKFPHLLFFLLFKSKEGWAPHNGGNQKLVELLIMVEIKSGLSSS